MINQNKEQILVVEDDQDIRDLIVFNLQKKDFNVKSTDSGDKAISLIREDNFNLILLDLMMPEMDGFEFAERLRENKEWLDIPVVVITAKDLTKEDHARLKGNVEAIMQKGSYSKNELLNEVSERIRKITEG